MSITANSQQKDLEDKNVIGRIKTPRRRSDFRIDLNYDVVTLRVLSNYSIISSSQKELNPRILFTIHIFRINGRLSRYEFTWTTVFNKGWDFRLGEIICFQNH